MSAPAKVCTCCGKAYDACAWAELPLVGFQFSEDESGAYELTLKNCTCGSTIGVEVKL